MECEELILLDWSPLDDPARPCLPKAGYGLVMMMMAMKVNIAFIGFIWSQYFHNNYELGSTLLMGSIDPWALGGGNDDDGGYSVQTLMGVYK